MNKHHKYDLKQIPTHVESVDRQGEFEFGLYKCLVHKTAERRIDRYCLIIGYVNESPKKYVVVENAPVSDKTGASTIKLHYVTKDTIERDFELSNRPQTGILKFPKKDDTVFCLAKERYQGVEGGKIYKVQSMDGERVDVHNSDYTYEPHYFVVINSSESTRSWPGEKIKEKKDRNYMTAATTKFVMPDFDGTNPPAMPAKPVIFNPTSMAYDSAELFDEGMYFRKLLVEEQTKIRKELPVKKLISRNKDMGIALKDRRRDIFTPETIHRQVI